MSDNAYLLERFNEQESHIQNLESINPQNEQFIEIKTILVNLEKMVSKNDL